MNYERPNKINKFIYLYFKVIRQSYETHVYDDFVIKGNTGVSLPLISFSPNN